MSNFYADMPASLEICTTVASHDVKPPPPKFDDKLIGFGSLMWRKKIYHLALVWFDLVKEHYYRMDQTEKKIVFFFCIIWTIWIFSILWYILSFQFLFFSNLSMVAFLLAAFWKIVLNSIFRAYHILKVREDKIIKGFCSSVWYDSWGRTRITNFSFNSVERLAISLYFVLTYK